MWGALALAALLGDLLGLEGLNDGDLLLLLLQVALLILKAVLDDSFDDLLGSHDAAGVDQHVLAHRFRNGVRIAELRWNVCLAVANDVDAKMLNELFGHFVGCADDDFVDVLEKEFHSSSVDSFGICFVFSPCMPGRSRHVRLSS